MVGNDSRANTLWKDRLKQYQDPGLDPDIDEALQAYIDNERGNARCRFLLIVMM